MPVTRYNRVDTVLIIRTAAVPADPKSPAAGDELSRQRIEVVTPWGLPSLLLDPARVEHDLLEWLAMWRWPSLPNPQSQTDSSFEIKRLVLQIEDPRWAEFDWESVFLEGVGESWRWPSVIRDSRVQPRVLQSSFVFPARVLELGVPRLIAAAVEATLQGSKETAAMVLGVARLADAQQFLERAKWSTADVLHIHDRADDDDLLCASRGEDPGTLGWILRAAGRWQTRLIVLEAGEASLPIVRRLGHEIVSRGGPAVVVADRNQLNRAGLYAAILHDRPLDWALQRQGGTTLFAGAGREELLRFSVAVEQLTQPQNVDVIVNATAAATSEPRFRPEPPSRVQIRRSIFAAARRLRVDVNAGRLQFGAVAMPKLIRFGDAVASNMLEKGFVVRPLDDDVRTLYGFAGGVPVDAFTNFVSLKSLPLAEVLDSSTAPRMADILRERLDNVSTSLGEMYFEDHESDATLPVALKTQNIRNLLRVSGYRPTAKPPLPRHVNSGFFRPCADGRLEEIPQATERISASALVHLGIRIGPKDALTVTVGDVALLEGAFPWTAGAEGCWIEIGVTPLDFENLGASVQEVWLPRDDEMPLVTFALKPRAETAVPGVARVRFTLYYRDNIVQSFLMAALFEAAAEDTTTLFATALGIEPTAIPNTTANYLMRLEYSAADPEQIGSLQPRALSIVANDIAGQQVFTVKGQDFFSSTVNNDFTTLVEDAREALRSASYNEELGEYRFRADNSGDYGTLEQSLWKIASAGWKLYFQMLPDEQARAAVRSILGAEGVVHAAHIALNQVVPWALLYDLPIDEGRDQVTVQENGQLKTYPVRRTLCGAGLPNVDGSLSPADCGVSEACVLFGADRQGRKRVGDYYFCRGTVVCPRHFWGFAHQIEVPAQQSQPGESPPPQIPTTISTKAPVAMAVGHNPNVRLAVEHLDALKAELAKRALFEEPLMPNRNEVIDLLNRIEPDVVYFYCHAYIDRLDLPGRPQPNLDFGHRLSGDIIVSADLQGAAWARKPLVFLNGCGTVGFSPAATSGFVTSFIQGRKASAVVGTEVTVWPELAGAVALAFLQEFIGDKHLSAGKALRNARRQLLLKNNPLGLVYTLYGSADLAIDLRGSDAAAG